MTKGLHNVGVYTIFLYATLGVMPQKILSWAKYSMGKTNILLQHLLLQENLLLVAEPRGLYRDLQIHLDDKFPHILVLVLRSLIFAINSVKNFTYWQD